MSPIERFVLTLGIIFISLGLGYLCNKQAEKGKFFIPRATLLEFGKVSQKIAIFFLMPFSAMLSLWGLPRPEAGLLALPMLGFLAYTWGGGLALALAKLLRMDRLQAGSFYCCGAYSNIAAIGGLICLIYLGENSIALVALYRLLEEMYFFGISFPVAALFGRGRGEAKAKRHFSPVILVIALALLTGLALNYIGYPRAAYFGVIASLMMLLATMIFLFSIGLTLRLSSIWNYRIQALVMCGIKFLGIPLVVTPCAIWLGYGSFDNGIILKTAFILSAMPVAMTALVPAAIFNLDLDLANACWIVSTLALAGVLPFILWLLPVL